MAEQQPLWQPEERPRVEPLGWADRPEQRTMGLTLEGSTRKQIELTIGNCAIALFRHRPELDYLAVQHEQVVEAGETETVWTYIFGMRELTYWMGGLALGKEDQRVLHLANRTHGSFHDRYGWNPDVVIEDYPSANEVENYLDYQMSGDLHDDLNNSLRETEE